MEITADALIRASDAAELLGVSKRLIYQFAESGKLRHYKFGKRRIAFATADVLASEDASALDIPDDGF